MKKLTLLLSLSLITILEAKTLTLSPSQLKDWNIQSSKVESIDNLPLGSFMAEVVTPPQYLYSITLPFEAQVNSLKVAQYESIKKGELLATVTGYEWIKVQQKFIQDSIELKHHKHLAERKNRLCQEEIIPKKECMAANAEYKADTIKFESAKALLRGYGATKQMINNLFSKMKISRTIPIYSKFSGKLLKLNIGVGESTKPSEALFVIQKAGALWLEVEMPVKKAQELKDGNHVKLSFHDEHFQSKVLLHAPSINSENQTQKVRFSLPNSPKFLRGLREMAKITTSHKSLKIPKKSVIDLEGSEVVFIQNSKGYEPVEIKILGEARNFYFVEKSDKLKQPIVNSSVAILKSMMEGEDE